MQDARVPLRLTGRRSSLYTRIPRLFAAALDVPHEFQVVMDMTATEPRAYGGNPALKLPVLREGDADVFGAQNICRRIAAHAAAAGSTASIVWPGEVPALLLGNAEELLAHCMSAQVQRVMGLQVTHLPAGNPYFTKAGAGMQGSLRWLDERLDTIRHLLPATRTLSYFEVALFCLLEHLDFRRTLPAGQQWAHLEAFREQFGQQPAAMATAYRYDSPDHRRALNDAV